MVGKTVDGFGEHSFTEGVPRLGEAAHRSERQRQEGEEAGGGDRRASPVPPRRDLASQAKGRGERGCKTERFGPMPMRRAQGRVRVRVWMERGASTEGCPHGGERVSVHKGAGLGEPRGAGKLGGAGGRPGCDSQAAFVSRMRGHTC